MPALVGYVLMLGLSACRPNPPALILEPELSGVIQDVRDVPGSMVNVFVLDGEEVEMDPREVTRIRGTPSEGSLLLVARDGGDLYYIAMTDDLTPGCYRLTPDSAFDEANTLVVVWWEEEVGIRLPKAPGFEPVVGDAETGLLLQNPGPSLCVDVQEVVGSAGG